MWRMQHQPGAFLYDLYRREHRCQKQQGGIIEFLVLSFWFI